MDRSRRLLLSQLLKCVNCNIGVNTCNTQRPRHVLGLDTRVVSLISNWIYPIIVTDETYICEACYDQAVHAANAEPQSNIETDPLAGPSRRGHLLVCLVCGRSLRSRQSHVILSQNQCDINQRIIEIIENRVAPHQISPQDRSCHACWMNASRNAIRHQQVDESRDDSLINQVDAMPGSSHEGLEIVPTEQEHSYDEPIDATAANEEVPLQSRPGSAEPPVQNTHIILPNYRRAPNTASHCLFAGCDQLNLHNISDPLRATILAIYKYYIPRLTRVCSEHLLRNDWDMLYDAVNNINSFTQEHLEHMLSFNQSSIGAPRPFLDFSSLESVEGIDDHLFKYWLGITKNNFTTLIRDLPQLSQNKNGILGLATILIKMRTGDSDARLSTLLNVPRSTLERIIKKVREILLQEFVPRNLGINHLPREELLHHNLMIPNGLFNQENLNSIVMCDGTYIFLNKSSNYMFQKDTYSLHKYKNLLKPFMLVSCNGYILDCFGPYKATTSDAEIMTSLFHNENSPLRQYFQENDIFILDRGFRDSISLLENCNYKPYMPESLLEGEHQLTTTQANRTRCITICRWVVEVVNGYFKRDFRLLRFDHFNKTVPNMMAYFQIAASLINKFGVRLQDRADAGQILSVIRERMPLDNNLSRVVSQLNLNRRASFFRSITAHDNNILFPRLEYSELILFALGTYQIRQARSYYGEHVRFQGGYRIEVSREPIDVRELDLRGSGENSLVRGKIKSRHIGRKQYFVYILVENNMNGREGITEYYCSCIVGRRTIGCCAHIMTMVWYLGWARYQDNILPPAAYLDDVVVREDME